MSKIRPSKGAPNARIMCVGGYRPVRVEPMKNFPVLRDLVVDTSDFLVKLEKSKPWIIRKVDACYRQCARLLPDGGGADRRCRTHRSGFDSWQERPPINPCWTFACFVQGS